MNIKPLLEQFALMLESEVKVVTKRFAPTVESVVTEDSITILGSPFIQTLIDGRPPTSNNPVRGPKSLQEIILEWIKDKGIQAQANAQGKTPDQTSLSWAISKSIHEHGDLLWQRGGGNDIFAGILTSSRINAFTNSIGSVVSASIGSDILKQYKR